MSDYIIIPESFALQNEGKRHIDNIFSYAKLKDGRYCCAFNSVKEFPDLFIGVSFEIEKINIDIEEFDLPQFDKFKI